MKRVLLIGGIVLALLTMLCVGLVIGVTVAPVQARIGQVIERVFDRDGQTGKRIFKQNVDGQSVSGLPIARVAADSPAQKAGLQHGDILVQVDGQPVSDQASLREILNDHQPGDTLKLLVRRGSQELTLTAKLAEPPDTTSGQQAYLGITPAGRMSRSPDETVNPTGARINQVVQGSPAETAGLKTGEVIQSVDGQALDGTNNLADIVAGHQPGDTVRLGVLRSDGQTRDVTVKLGENPDKKGAAWLGIQYSLPLPNGDQMPFMPGSPNQPDHGFSERGIPFPPGNLHGGALVRDVEPGSPADKAGLKAGQIVEAIDGQKLTSTKALMEIIAGHRPGDTLTLTVYQMPSDKAAEIKVTLGENPQKAGAAWMGIQFDFLNINFDSDSSPEG